MVETLLVVIDYQTDFVTGSLGNPAAVPLEGGIAALAQETLAQGGCVLFTRDTHGPDYLQTREGKFLPVPHCVQNTPGWHLHGALAEYEQGRHSRVALADKPTFGCAEIAAHAVALCGGAPRRIDICGVVTDICVVSNAVLLHSHFLQADIRVHGDLCAAATPEGHRRALDVLAGMGYAIV